MKRKLFIALVILAVLLGCNFTYGLAPYPCEPLDSVDVYSEEFDLNCQVVGKLPDTLGLR